MVNVTTVYARKHDICVTAILLYRCNRRLAQSKEGTDHESTATQLNSQSTSEKSHACYLEWLQSPLPPMPTIHNEKQKLKEYKQGRQGSRLKAWRINTLVYNSSLICSNCDFRWKELGGKMMNRFALPTSIILKSDSSLYCSATLLQWGWRADNTFHFLGRALSQKHPMSAMYKPFINGSKV